MSELLEDPDGAPYPEPVQELWSKLEFDEGQDELRTDLVAALESVAANAWDRGHLDAVEWQSAYRHGDNGPPDPPRNPHERA